MVGTSKLRYLFNEKRGLEVVEVVPSQASEEIAAINKNWDETGSNNNKNKELKFFYLELPTIQIILSPQRRPRRTVSVIISLPLFGEGAMRRSGGA